LRKKKTLTWKNRFLVNVNKISYIM
jgi:hypothetical protein